MFEQPKWRKPASLGYPAALDAVGNIAAPLLAGFSLTSVVAIAANMASFRWPGAAILSLTMASLLLVNAVQCNFYARRNLWSADDVRAWWPDLEQHKDWEERLRQEQHSAFRRWRTWADWTTRLYNAGIVMLMIGLACILPPLRNGGIGVFRWIATAFAFATALGEFAWVITATRKGR
jgi:hypothetical protein